MPVHARRHALSGPLLLASVALALAWGERKRPLRVQAAPDPVRRMGRNLALAGFSAAMVQITERPITLPLSRYVARTRAGLVPRLGLPSWAELSLSVILMDYTLYIWHVLTHRVPLLWRFHRVHHADLDMDASTAIRFHLGEFVLGIPYRAAQIGFIGVSPGALTVWQRLTLAEIMFHHSNLRLPHAIEQTISWFVITPRLHGIHHSVQPDERDTNWSSVLTLWDWLHGTLRRDVPQRRIAVGVAGLRSPAAVTLPKLLTLPFGRQEGEHRDPAPAAAALHHRNRDAESAHGGGRLEHVRSRPRRGRLHI